MGRSGPVKKNSLYIHVQMSLWPILCLFRKRTSTSSSGKSARRSNCTQQWNMKHNKLCKLYILACITFCPLYFPSIHQQCVIDAYKGLRPTKASNTCVQLGLQGKRAKQVGRGDHHSSLDEYRKSFLPLVCPFQSWTDCRHSLRPSSGLKPIQSLW